MDKADNICKEDSTFKITTNSINMISTIIIPNNENIKSISTTAPSIINYTSNLIAIVNTIPITSIEIKVNNTIINTNKGRYIFQFCAQLNIL